MSRLRNQGVRRFIAGVATCALVAGTVVTAVAGGSAQAAAVITEFPLASGGASPVGLVAGADGNLWVAEAASNSIARVTPSGASTEFSLPTANSAPLFLAAGPDGNVWFTEHDGSRIGKITPAGAISEFATLTGGSGPAGITAGPDGNLWFTESLVDQIGRITTAGVITEFPVPTPFSGVGGITAGADGNLWFTETAANKLGRLTPAGAITEFTVPTANSQPAGITSGPDGALWFTERSASKVARSSTAGAITEVATPTAAAMPTGITTGPDGALWFTESQANKVGHLTPGSAIVEETIPTAGADATDITTGPDKNVWFTETGVGKVGRRAEAVPETLPEASTITVAANPNYAIEGGTDGAFAITRSGDMASSVNVLYTVTGTASSGTDYSALPSVVIPAGKTSVTIPVHALVDNLDDDVETVVVTLSHSISYTIGLPSTATVTIGQTAPATACAAPPAASYTDHEKFDVFAGNIDCVSHYGLAQGFEDGSYGPTLDVSRAQMASFVARLLVKVGVQFPSTLTDVFPGDSAGLPHELSIDVLGSVGIFDGTTGEQGDKYGVSEPMRRDDMAQILVNAYKVITGTPLPAGSAGQFADVKNGGDPHGTGTDNADAIRALANSRVVKGKTTTTYEPASPVSRAEFAAFFARYLQLLVDAGHLTPM